MTRKLNALKLLLILTIGQVAYGQSNEKMALDKVNEAVRLENEGRFIEAFNLLKEAEKLTSYKSNQVFCGGPAHVFVSDSIRSIIGDNYLKKYFSDTTKSILRGKITNNIDTLGVPFVNIKLINSKDSSTIVQTDFDGLFIIKPSKGIYKLEISYLNYFFNDTIELTNAPFKLFLNFNLLTNKTQEFKLTKLDLNNSNIKK